MWDFGFIIPCTLMMVTLLGFYFSRPRPPLLLNKVFLGLLVLEFLVLVVDIISTKVDEMHELFSPATLYVANTAFFVLFVLRIFYFYQFTQLLLSTLIDAQVTRKWLLALPFVATEVICVSSFATGAIFSVQDGAYASGPLYPVLTAVYFLYEGLSIGFVLLRANRLRRQELACALAFNLALVAGTAIRALLPRLLVMDTFCLVAITIIYLGFLNPDLCLSEYGPAFNTRSLRMVLREKSHQAEGHLLGFSLHNYTHERSVLGSRRMDEVVSHIISYLRKTFPHEIPFYLRDGRFALIGTEPHAEERLSMQIQQRFAQGWHSDGADFFLGVSFVYMDNSVRTLGADRVMNNLIIALDNARQTVVPSSSQEAISLVDVSLIDNQVDTLRLLEHALSHNGIEVYFQPLINSKTRTVEGAEALVRLRDQMGKIVPPGKFIPIAEKSGHIIELGRQVLDKTCEFVSTHDMRTLGLNWINVNLSPIQCMQQDIDLQFSKIIGMHHIDPSLIHLEITEESMVDYALLRHQITSLEQRGFTFVLDDYGSGYSNLTRVKHYPFNTIKLDMEVVWDYFKDRDSLLPSIVQGFKSVGLSITAEGIESEEMAQALTSIGSDYLQGFYFSKPLPCDEFEQLLLSSK